MARREEHYWSLRTRKPIITMGTDVDSANASIIMPGKTSCMDCKRDILRRAEAEERPTSCIAEPDPSVLNSNLIAASLAVNELDYILAGLPILNVNLKYDSKSAQMVSTVPYDEVCKHYDK